MSFTPTRDSTELKLFRKTVYDFARKEIYPNRAAWEKLGETPRSIYKKLAEQGLLGIRYPESVGGLGLDFYYTEAFCEEMVLGSALMGSNINIQVHMDMATPIINAIGTEEQKQLYLRAAISGDKVFALGVTEPDTGSDVARIRTTAKIDGSDYVISGAKTFITNGSEADYITLAVRTGADSHKGISLMVFDTKTKGFSVGRRLEKMGCFSSDTAELHFDNCRIPKSCLLGEENQGFYYVMKNFQIERLIIAIDAVMMCRLMLDETKKYMLERKSFGQRLWDHAVLRHDIVELETEFKATHLLCRHVSDQIVAGQDVTMEIAMAKYKAAELANVVATRCLQMFGGYGYMEEYEMARYFRDARVLNIVGGTSHIMKEIIGKKLIT